MWNYIFYKAYLKFKEVTEYNGDESYVFSKIEKFDISWIPKKRTKKIKD
jgi:inositol 1,4,5-triphosphate receptor type 3